MVKHIFKIALAGVILLSSCNNEPFEIGNHLVDPRITPGMIDTVSVRVSNLVLFDSVVSVGRGIGFWGVYDDHLIGSVRAKTFLEFGRTTDRETDLNSVFDSITLVLRPNGVFYGDTTGFDKSTDMNAAIKVFMIDQQIERGEDGSLYSTSSVPLRNQALVDTVFMMPVLDLQNNEIEIKLPGSFGRALFQGILRDDEEYRQPDFHKTFPGLAVVAGDRSNCVYGILLNDTSCMIRIYYHISTTSREEKKMTFTVNQFNSFYNKENDLAKLPPDMDSRSAPIPSSQTGNRGIITSGSTPIFTRLEFPHLNELLWLGQVVSIKRATLYVRPVQHTFDTIPLPASLNVYYFDPTSNLPMGSAIRPPSVGGGVSSGPQHGSLPANYRNIQSPDLVQYTFDITDFIAGQLGRVGHEKWALSLLIADNERDNTIQRFVFGDQNFWWHDDERQSMDNRIKLEVTYEVYNE